MTVPAADNLRAIVRYFGFRLPSPDVAEISLAADLLEAIDALPDELLTVEATANTRLGYRYAMRQVKALLHPPVPAEETLPNTQGDR